MAKSGAALFVDFKDDLDQLFAKVDTAARFSRYRDTVKPL